MFDLHHLPNPLPEEHLVYFLRRHPITILSVIVSFVLVLCAPFAAYWYLTTFQSEMVANQNTLTLIVLFGSIFFLYAWLFLFQNFIDYYLDMWIVTNHRILSIEQSGLFSRTASELRLYRIQDVTATVSGAMHTILDYGDVEIQTAGEKEHFRFEDVSHPNNVAKKILELSEVDRRTQLDVAVEEFGLADQKKAAEPQK